MNTSTELKHLGILPFGDVLQRHMEKSSPKDPGTPLSPTIPVLGVFLDEETLISTTADRALRAAAQAGDRSQFETLAGQAQIRPEAVARAWDTYTAPPVPAAADPAVRAVRYASLRGLPAVPVPPWAGYPLRADLALPVSRAPAA